MSDVTQILKQLEQGDASRARELLPLVYDELKELARARMSSERSEHTLQATALVHEAYLRLTDKQEGREWEGRGHFFAAAAEAMRRILIDHARRKNAQKRGGEAREVHLDTLVSDVSLPVSEMLDLDEVLTRLDESDPQAAAIVKLRVFVGLTVEEAAEALNVPARTAYRNWSYAQAWLFRELNAGTDE